MEIKISKKEEKPLLNREEYLAQVFSEKTPSYVELKKIISQELKKEEQLIAIKKVNQKFGTSDTSVSFYIYTNKDIMAKLEKNKEKKNTEAPPAA